MYLSQARFTGTPLPPAFEQTYTSTYGAAPANYPEKRGHGAATPRVLFILAGVLLLSMLCVVPMWNGLSLAMDSNYVFWLGRTIPHTLLISCIMLIGLYIFTMIAFFNFARPAVQNEQTIMMMANLFITLLGLILMLVSLPLSSGASSIASNLMHRCEISEQTHRLYEYSQVLHNIRADPTCASMKSIELCPGYKAAPPYTDFLQSMENEFRCSGFCYRTIAGQAVPAPVKPQPAGPAPDAPVTTATGENGQAAAGGKAVESKAETSSGKSAEKTGGDKAASGASTIAGAAKAEEATDTTGAVSVKPDGKAKTLLLLEEADVYDLDNEDADPAPTTVSRYPPTLFSDANYQATCEGMAARDMQNFAADVGLQTFYQGIYLVLIGIAMGFLKLIGLCLRRPGSEASKAY